MIILFFELILSKKFIVCMQVLFWGLLAFITMMSLMPNPDDLPGGAVLFRWLAQIILGDPDQSDKVTHFLAYGTITGIGIFANIRPLGSILLLPIMTFIVSGLLEIAQGFTNSRVPDLFDLLANGSGVLVGAFIALMLLLLANKIDENTPS